MLPSAFHEALNKRRMRIATSLLIECTNVMSVVTYHFIECLRGMRVVTYLTECLMVKDDMLLPSFP
jgi:hypothetical protein